VVRVVQRLSYLAKISEVVPTVSAVGRATSGQGPVPARSSCPSGVAEAPGSRAAAGGRAATLAQRAPLTLEGRPHKICAAHGTPLTLLRSSQGPDVRIENHPRYHRSQHVWRSAPFMVGGGSLARAAYL